VTTRRGLAKAVCIGTIVSVDRCRDHRYGGPRQADTRRASGRQTEAKTKLRELLRDQDDGVPTPVDGYTVADAVAYWLTRVAGP